MSNRDNGLVLHYANEMMGLLSQFDNATDENDDPSLTSKPSSSNTTIAMPEWAGVWKSSLDAMQKHGSPAAVSTGDTGDATAGERAGEGGSSRGGGGAGIGGGRAGGGGSRGGRGRGARGASGGGGGGGGGKAVKDRVRSAYAPLSSKMGVKRVGGRGNGGSHISGKLANQRKVGGRGRGLQHPVLRNNLGPRSKSANVQKRPSGGATANAVRPKTTQPVRPPGKAADDARRAGPDSPLKKAREAKRKQQKAATQQPAPTPQVVMDEMNNSFESVDKERVKIATAISSLPDKRKMYLLQMLEDAEKDLLNVSVETEKEGEGEGEGVDGRGSGAGRDSAEDDEYSDESDFEASGAQEEAANNDTNNRRGRGAQERPVAPADSIGLIKPPVPQLRPTLERIAGALTKAKTGPKGMATNKRFPPTKRTMLGPAALLDTLSRDLKLTLSSKEVELLVQHFDPTRARLLDYRDLIELGQR